MITMHETLIRAFALTIKTAAGREPRNYLRETRSRNKLCALMRIIADGGASAIESIKSAQITRD